jgi:hypothetical protein
VTAFTAAAGFKRLFFSKKPFVAVGNEHSSVVSATGYQATIAGIDQDEDVCRRAAGETPSAVPMDDDTARPSAEQLLPVERAA